MTALPLLSLTLLFGPQAQAQELTGYAEARAQLSGGVEGTPWSTTQVFRPEFEMQPHDRVKVVSAVQFELSQGRYPVEEGLELAVSQFNESFISDLEEAGCSVEAPLRYDSVDDLLSVERLYVDLYTPYVDVRVGRQSLNWGSALYLNPSDLFGEVLVTEPWAQRQGNDGVRATVPIGERHQVVAAGATGSSLRDGRFGLKATFNALNTDFSALGALVTDWQDVEPFVGFDVKGQLFVGWWAEGRTSLDAPALVLSTGVDYSFPVGDQLLVAAQYTYDGTGLEDPALYSLSARGSEAPLPECAQDVLEVQRSAPRFTIGRHYGLLMVRAAAWDLWSADAAAVMNLQDASTLLIPQVSWKPGEAWALSVGAQLPLGDGELAPGPALSLLDLGPAELELSGLVPEWSVYTNLRFSL